MNDFNYHDGHLLAEAVDVREIAQQYGTPCYVYSRAGLERCWHAFDDALGQHPHLICYAVKANSTLAVLNLMARLGSGFDIVSIGELERVIRAGGDPGKMVFSGVGKREDEIRRALQVRIRCFNVESEAEIHSIQRIAGELDCIAPVSLRVNPDVDAKTHPYISTGLKENKFGVDINAAVALFHQAHKLPNLKLCGIDCHIGSQLTTLAPFNDALQRVLALASQLSEDGIPVTHLDLGGGLGIRYRDEQIPSPAEYCTAILKTLHNSPYEILLEPGRAIAGNAGILLTRVEYLKHTSEHNFAIVDAAMNDLMRPALYNAWQDIIPVVQRSDLATVRYDVVGPVCETGDFLGKDRQLAIDSGDLLAIRSAGAYGFSMASQYNTRPRAAEVIVDGSSHTLIRQRETLDQLMMGETILP